MGNKAYHISRGPCIERNISTVEKTDLVPFYFSKFTSFVSNAKKIFCMVSLISLMHHTLIEAVGCVIDVIELFFLNTSAAVYEVKA